MKKIAMICGLLFGLSQLSQAATMPKGDADAGKQMTTACSACHGADGNSAAPTFPKLADQNARYLFKQLQDIRDGARPVPTMIGQLDGKSDQQLADIAAYYAAQPRSGSQTDPELLELGEKVYRSGVAERGVAACTACHSPRGKGNAPAGFPSLAGQHADYIASQLKMYRQGYEDEAGRTNDGDTRIMRTTAFGLSDKEIEAVASYAAGLK
ncbi:cytochrome c4 [Parahaliea sp. F7430]|uniref:Cytochrome c4 n=1 Tax=Sediminihaliea albiluteola TaxID=2758564 RepID=A0A7W2TXN5_9GAMM|nr:c-type cytochrome [Sediminihaliea albiluteola]MBA6413822.1 cytochrome c4 [Sediminihaliea albiluteola]